MKFTLFLLGIVLMLVSGLLLLVRRQPITSAWIWYVSVQDGEIYRMWQDGSHQEQITNDDGRKMQLAISPDDERLAFVSDEDGNDEVYVMSIFGDDRQRLTNASSFDGHPSWSPDGEWLAFYSGRDGNAEIYKMRADGDDPTRLTDRSGFDGQPIWSSDGAWIGFMANDGGNPDLFLIPADGGEPQRLTTNPDYDSTADFSPDGEWLVYTEGRAHDADFDIVVMRTDGSERRVVTPENDSRSYYDARWSPDGEWVTFWGTDNSSNFSFQIFRVRSDGSDFTALTEVGPFLGPEPSRIVGVDWRGGWVLLLGLLLMLPQVGGYLLAIYSQNESPSYSS